MATRAQQVDFHHVHIDRFFPKWLCGIRMEKRSPLFAERANLSDGLYHTYLIVGMHDRDYKCLVGNGRRELFQV